MADTAAEPTQTKTGTVDVNDLIPCCGVGCFMTSLYTEWPDMIGCAGKNTCICMSAEFIGCKFANEPDRWWLCSQGSSWLESPKVCCTERAQICCLDVRGSLPCTDEVPCMLTICFFTVFYYYFVVDEMLCPSFFYTFCSAFTSRSLPWYSRKAFVIWKARLVTLKLR